MSEASIPSISGARFCLLFPFYLAWDRDLIITSVGPALKKICPSVVDGTNLRDHFTVLRPHGDLQETLSQKTEKLLVLMESMDKKVRLRGQILAPEEAADGTTIFLCGPWLSEPGQIDELGLRLTDFPIHDQTIDLLQLLQTQKTANADLQRLTSRLLDQKAKLRLQEAEARKLAMIASKTSNGVVMTDSHGRIEWVNAGFTKLSGWTIEDARGKTPGSLLQGPGTDPRAVEKMRRAIQAGEAFQVEVLNYHRWGAPYWVSVEAQPVFADNKLTQFVAVETDISERVVSETSQQMQLAVATLLAQGGDLASMGAAVLEAVGSRLGWTFGCLWTPNEAGSHLVQSAQWDDRAGGREQLAETSRALTFAPGEGLPGQVWLNGTPIWLSNVEAQGDCCRGALANKLGLPSAMALPIKDGDDFYGTLEFFGPKQQPMHELTHEALGAVCSQIGRFITRRRSEALLLSAKETAETASRAKSDFLATMSHEIRTPMNGVLGFTQLLQQTPLTQQQAEFVSAIRTSSEILLNVINDVLDFSKIESGRMEIEHVAFSLERCVEEALESVSATAAEKGLDLAARIAPGVPTSVWGDALRVRQVLVNLLSNAVKFTDRGEVSLTVDLLEKPEHGLIFRVRDSGIGIPADKLDGLFQPFHQVDSSTSRQYGGSGLGLAICRNLIHLMGGTVSVESEVGVGTTFTVEIKAAPSEQPAPSVHPQPFPALLGRRALIVDGFPLSRSVVSELLERWGLDVRTAPSALEARKVLQSFRPHIALLDIQSASDDVSLATTLSAEQVGVFLMSRPNGGARVRERFGDKISGTLFKPLRVSPLFNVLLAQAEGANTRRSGLHRLIAPIDTSARPLRLLLAEDNTLNRKLALAALRQLGCSADVAQNGFEAVHAAQVGHYDCIFMDVQMPGMDGLAATRAIRAWELDSRSERVRIVALTANVLSGDREICLEAGMDDFLPKPLRLDALRAVLAQLRPGEPAPPSSQPAPLSKRESPILSALRALASDLTVEEAMSYVGEFLATVDGQVLDLDRRLSAGEWVVAGRIAHTLKGTANLFGLIAVKETAASVEKACRDLAAEEARRAFAELKLALPQALTDLQLGKEQLASPLLRMT